MVTVVCTVPVHVVHVRTVHGTTCTTYHGTRTFHVSHGCGQRIIGHCAHTHIKHVCMNDECTHVFFNARFSLGPEDPTFGTFQCTPLPNPETSRCWSQCLDTVNNFAAARCSLHSAFHRLASLCTGDMDYDWTRGTIVW